MAMNLEVGNLRRAIAAMDSLVTRTTDSAWMASQDDVVRQGLRSGVIQHFEFTFELCWKLIQRWLRDNAPATDADLPRSRRELFRQAARFALIADPSHWFAYGDARNLTSHTYNEATADTVFRAAQQFLPDAQRLLANLEAARD
jgi:nucleotidyltransferase substrate binding protein (TIGR01987 family)